jgi:hypothetical protein
MAFAQQRGQYGTADEARAMLLNAVAATADKAKALYMFNKGKGGFGWSGSATSREWWVPPFWSESTAPGAALNLRSASSRSSHHFKTVTASAGAIH